MGAGPVPCLCDKECQDFDKAFVEAVYAHNVAVIALATEGIQRGQSKNIRDISGEIRTKRTSENIKLANWYSQMGCGNIANNYDRAEQVVASLCDATGSCFDANYAMQMTAMLQQSVAANQMGIDKATFCALRDHARVSYRNACNEAFRLQRWTDQRGQVARAD